MKSILITGGSGKVGFQLVNHFLKTDFLVMTTTRSKDGFMKSRETQLSEKHSEKLKLIEVDFNLKGADEEILSFLVREKLKPQHIIHNARCLDFLRLEEDNSVSDANFIGELYMDVVFPYQLTLKAFNTIKELESVVFISSIYGIVAPTPSLYDNFHKSSPINYGVSKAAQIHLTKELAVRMSPKVRVNCVSFGGIKGRVNDAFLQKYNALTPMGKMIDETEVTGPLDFLISPQSKNMTGQNLIVDGGWTIW